MGIFDNFPYTNFHELNLDWILEMLQQIDKTMDQFVAINALKYADPIQWNIVKQYEKNTIVIDPLTGTAYISVQPVPSGVIITNTDYWSVVFDLGSFVVRAAKNFTNKYEEDTTLTATFPSSVNDWLIWGDTLYRVIAPIIAGDQYVENSNIVHFTMEDIIGYIQDLETTDKSNLVAAINELVASDASIHDLIGELSDLITSDQTSIVNAINSVSKDIYYINIKNFGAKGDGVTDDTAAVQDAIDSISEKSVIYFPDGVYVINGTINITKSGVVIFGDTNAKITRTIQDSTDIFRVYNDSGISIYNFECYGLTFNDIPDGCCFKIIDVHNSYIHDCYISMIKNFITYGEHNTTNRMNIWSIVQHIIGNVKVEGSKFIELESYTNGLHIYDCQINAELSLSSATFFDCRPYSGIDTIDIQRCLLQRFIYCIQIGDKNTSDVLQNFFIYNNIMDSNKNYCLIAEKNVNPGYITRLNISNNWFNVDGAIPLAFTASTGYLTEVNIDSNIFVRCPSRAVLIQGNNAHGIKINGNVFNGFNVNPAGGAPNSCVTIGGVCDGIIISNNQFTPTADITANNQYGIYVETGCVGTVISGNNFKDVITPITNGGTGTIITGNYPDSVNDIKTGATKYGNDILSYYSGGSWVQIPALMRKVGNKFFAAVGDGTYLEVNKVYFAAPYSVRWNGSSLQYLDADGETWVDFTAP